MDKIPRRGLLRKARNFAIVAAGAAAFRGASSEVAHRRQNSVDDALQINEPIDKYVDKMKLDALIAAPIVNKSQETFDTELIVEEAFAILGDCRMQDFLNGLGEGSIRISPRLFSAFSSHIQSESTKGGNVAVTSGLGLHQVTTPEFNRDGKTFLEEEVKNEPDSRYMFILMGADDLERALSNIDNTAIQESYLAEYKEMLEEIINFGKIPIPIIMPSYPVVVETDFGSPISEKKHQTQGNPLYNGASINIDYDLVDIFKDLDIPFINLYGAITDYETPLNYNDEYLQTLADSIDELFSPY